MSPPLPELVAELPVGPYDVALYGSVAVGYGPREEAEVSPPLSDVAGNTLVGAVVLAGPV